MTFARSSLLLATLLVACTERMPSPLGAAPANDGGLPADDGGLTTDAGLQPIDLRVEGGFARSAHTLSNGGALLVYETPVHIRESWGHPRRRLSWIDASGKETARRDASAGRELLDAAPHPSGEVTVLEASANGYFLLRVTSSGSVLGELRIEDAAIATDPPAIKPSESRSPIEEVTHDTGRLAPDGEGVFLGTRTGRHSVISYRASWDGVTFVLSSRNLVVPAHAITQTALTGGSYDTFGQLDAQYNVFVAVDGTGVGWVGVGHVRLETGEMVEAHEKVFGEKLVTDPDFLDAFVSRVSRSGDRLGTTVVSTPNDDQLYALRPAESGVFALGRTEEWNELGTGFDALIARIDANGAASIHVLDVDRGDIAFDAHADGVDIIVAGASGYAQNPHGASISEESHTFLRLLRPDKTTSSITVPNGPRHSEARFAIPHSNGVLVGGMLDGPGTHSADGDVALLRAKGFVTWAKTR